MSKLSLPTSSLVLAAALALMGCEANPATSTTSTSSGNDTSIAKDSSGAGDASVVDTVAGDASGGDTAPKPDGVVQDVKEDAVLDTESDGTGFDTSEVVPTDITGDVKPDSQPDVAPAKCTSDADCPKAFSDCIASKCDVATGACQDVIATDGTACKSGGTCGGTGICKQGACAFKGACEPVDCTPAPLACGAKVVLDPTKLGPSGTAIWGCAGGKAWDGGEKFFALASDATTTATVELSGDTTSAAALMLLGTYTPGSCAPKACVASKWKQVLGVSPTATQILAVETKASSTALLTLTVVCAVKPSCGDGQCGDGETCSGCPKDCGTCPACGDKNCDATTENCGSCPADCGACATVAPECIPKSEGDPNPTGCGGCGCEKCVCDMDSYCCDTAWDNTCVGECTDSCKGPTCDAVVTWCGDGACNGKESTATCPQDCAATSSSCGDGECGKFEKCSSCPGDCGPCQPTTVAAVCGDGKCNGSEHCAVCPQDCGVCASNCASLSKTSSAPGCGGCACEAEVCAADPYCCKSAWDSLCVSQCKSSASAKCPANTCGDGFCSATETCTSCQQDCGPCACGDGVCSSSESASTCPEDCPLGCSSASTPGCSGCACEAEVCAQDKYCCSNKWDGTCVSECKATGKMPCK